MMLILIIVLAVLIGNEASSINVYGKWANKEIDHFLDSLGDNWHIETMESGNKLLLLYKKPIPDDISSYEPFIKYLETHSKMKYIGRCAIPILTTYHLEGVGTVTRWSKADRRLRAMFND